MTICAKKITCIEDLQFTADYHDPGKRSIANALTMELNDGTVFEEQIVEYPIGHARRRQEGNAVARSQVQNQFSPSISAQATAENNGDFIRSERAGKHSC